MPPEMRSTGQKVSRNQNPHCEPKSGKTCLLVAAWTYHTAFSAREIRRFSIVRNQATQSLIHKSTKALLSSALGLCAKGQSQPNHAAGRGGKRSIVRHQTRSAGGLAPSSSRWRCRHHRAATPGRPHSTAKSSLAAGLILRRWKRPQGRGPLPRRSHQQFWCLPRRPARQQRRVPPRACSPASCWASSGAATRRKSLSCATASRFVGWLRSRHAPARAMENPAPSSASPSCAQRRCHLSLPLPSGPLPSPLRGSSQNNQGALCGRPASAGVPPEGAAHPPVLSHAAQRDHSACSGHIPRRVGWRAGREAAAAGRAGCRLLEPAVHVVCPRRLPWGCKHLGPSAALVATARQSRAAWACASA